MNSIPARGKQRQRLDEAVVARGLAESRSRARALILAREVKLNGVAAHHASTPVWTDDQIDLLDKPRFVSRGGEKLAHALAHFSIDPTDRVAADLGASTGGFTDCLIASGARLVYAIDVGYGQLADRLRRDARIIVLDRTNARSLEQLPELVDIVTIDVSFISLRLVLPTAKRLLKPDGVCIPLVKPQFEAGRADVGKGGVVRQAHIHHRILNDTMRFADSLGFGVVGLVRSPLQGPAGNYEYLAHLVLGSATGDMASMVEHVIPSDLS